MAQLTPKERLQPSLLDRLATPKPEHRGLTVTVTVEQLRESVRRELAALFSAVALEMVDKGVEARKEVRRSSLNFGMPALTGKMASSVNVALLERHLARAIKDFEPRLAANTLRVRACGEDNDKAHNRLAFEIEGELWAQPLPQKLLLRTELDLESGQVKVEESRG